MIIHTFGAYFGLSVAWMTKPDDLDQRDGDNCPTPQSDVFSMIGNYVNQHVSPPRIPLSHVVFLAFRVSLWVWVGVDGCLQALYFCGFTGRRSTPPPWRLGPHKTALSSTPSSRCACVVWCRLRGHECCAGDSSLPWSTFKMRRWLVRSLSDLGFFFCLHFRLRFTFANSTMSCFKNMFEPGGVAIGASADMFISPFAAMLVGFAAGTISVFGFVFVQGLLLRKLSLHDTCGVHVRFQLVFLVSFSRVFFFF